MEGLLITNFGSVPMDPRIMGMETTKVFQAQRVIAKFVVVTTCHYRIFIEITRKIVSTLSKNKYEFLNRKKYQRYIIKTFAISQLS